SLLPILGVSILVAKNWKQRVCRFLMFIPMVSMLIMTNSRSAWILAGVAFLVFLVIMLVRKWGMKGIYSLLVVLTLVSGGLFLEYNNRSSPFRAFVRDYFHYRIDSFDAHFLLLEGAWQVFEMYPYFGGGTGGFYEQF